jgi:hypothetical protein
MIKNREVTSFHLTNLIITRYPQIQPHTPHIHKHIREIPSNNSEFGWVGGGGGGGGGEGEGEGEGKG